VRRDRRSRKGNELSMPRDKGQKASSFRGPAFRSLTLHLPVDVWMVNDDQPKSPNPACVSLIRGHNYSGLML